MADPKKAGAGAEAEAAAAGASAASGGLKAWLPLIVTVLAIPALAFATTQYIVLPKIHSAMGAPADAGAHDAGAEGDDAAAVDGHGAPAPAASDSGGHGGKGGKATAAINKMIVNVAGTMGTRYLVASVTLVGSGADFKARIDDHRDQLLDVATGTLSNKTIADLEKPGARNEVRSELLSVFNNVLGGNAVREIYITELAIQ